MVAYSNYFKKIRQIFGDIRLLQQQTPTLNRFSRGSCCSKRPLNSLEGYVIVSHSYMQRTLLLLINKNLMKLCYKRGGDRDDTLLFLSFLNREGDGVVESEK
ncbi:Uncharacterized protein Rs2_49615 [Raphanus sativus]|nr:Uncharacterized protein Rs2_49615 [Raphanus sativus]